MRSFAARVIAWQRRHGRNGLPWQGRDPYRVWIAEVMLQQTQVRTVIPYYERFVARFPDLGSLAQAPLGDVMRLWAGLGYYSRARNLHACARRVARDLGGTFPHDAKAIGELPGIGRSTAAAIAAFCFDERVPILDGNVKRLLARHRALQGDPVTRAVERRLWEVAEALLPAAHDMPAYTQGVMDLGAMVCTRSAPACSACPVRGDCLALRHERVAELPTRAAGKVRPMRRACFLVVVAGDAVLLERRAAAGIWGGLLAPPQFADARAMRRAFAAMAPTGRLRALPARKHGFTHFNLAFTPHLAILPPSACLAAEPAHCWLPFDEIATAALPAPIRALLRDVQQGHAAPPRATRPKPARAAVRASGRRGVRRAA